jgi:hypothetical protein
MTPPLDSTEGLNAEWFFLVMETFGQRQCVYLPTFILVTIPTAHHLACLFDAFHVGGNAALRRAVACILPRCPRSIFVRIALG